MRNHGSPTELQHRRLLAVQRVLEGYTTEEVAEFLDVDPRSVRRWVAAYHVAGDDGLAASPVSGRPPKLTFTQEKIIRRWVGDRPSQYGFDTELWTAPRLSQLIREEFGIHFNHRYLSSWLRRRGLTPQKPQRVPRQRDPQAIVCWMKADWPRIQKRPDDSMLESS